VVEILSFIIIAPNCFRIPIDALISWFEREVCCCICFSVFDVVSEERKVFSGKPVFMNDPTYPHNQLITLAHCTAPRRMNGRSLEPARIMTHFESDYGAAPKVEMHVGQTVTNIMPDFAFKLYTGLPGKIVDNPMLDICRSQIDIGFECDSRIVAEKMHGFHWITVYGDYLREMDYALKKIGIKFENLG